jgi:hypothetical protein
LRGFFVACVPQDDQPEIGRPERQMKTGAGFPGMFPEILRLEEVT